MKTPTVISTLHNVCMCVWGVFFFGLTIELSFNIMHFFFFFAQLKYFPFADIFACF